MAEPAGQPPDVAAKLKELQTQLNDASGNMGEAARHLGSDAQSQYEVAHAVLKLARLVMGSLTVLEDLGGNLPIDLGALRGNAAAIFSGMMPAIRALEVATGRSDPTKD